MTEELAKLIAEATCVFCRGEGKLAHRIANARFAGEVITYTEGVVICGECDGDGVNPDFRHYQEG